MVMVMEKRRRRPGIKEYSGEKVESESIDSLIFSAINELEI